MTSHITVIRSTETICSCNSCGAPNFEEVRDAEVHAPATTPDPIARGYRNIGLVLWELRVRMGSMTNVTTFCTDCLRLVRRAAYDAMSD